MPPGVNTKANTPPWQRPDENWPRPLPGTTPDRPILIPPPQTPRPVPPPSPTPAPPPTPPAQGVRPPREGLPPFPTGRGEPRGGVFQRLPPGWGDRPIPQPPDIPSPGVVLRTGERVNQSSVIDPVNVFAYGSVGVLVYLLAKRNQAVGAEPPGPPAPPAAGALGVPTQQPPPEPPDPERDRLRATLADQKRREQENREVLSDIGEWLEGSVAGKLVQKAAKLGKVPFEIGKELLTPRAAGQGEEDAIARDNARNKELRERFARLAFALLSLTPGASGGGPAVEMPPIWEADP